jgi:hypothetical protein
LSSVSTDLRASFVLSFTSPWSIGRIVPVLGFTPHEPEQKTREERGEKMAGERKGAGGEREEETMGILLAWGWADMLVER